MDAEHFESRAHHERIGLTDEIRLLARRHLYRRYERAARGDDAVLDGTREIGIRADELRAVSDEVRRMDDRLIVIARGLADYDIIRVDTVHCDTLVIERVDESRGADNICRAAGLLTADKFCRCEGTGIKMTLVNIKSHSLKLLLKLTRRAFARIRKEQERLVFFIQPLHELFDIRKQSVSVIYDTVHITYKSFFCF